MVTAVLPSVTVSRKLSKYPEVVPRDSPILGRPSSTSISSEATITPARLAHGSPNEKGSRFHSLLSGSRLPGFVGAFAGLGALVALGCFLPLPSQFQKLGISPRASLKDAYYFVATIALVVSFFCFVGLRGLRGEQQKSIYALWRPKGNPEQGSEHRPYWKLLVESVEVAWHYPNICLGYIGGFVARASSVGISLFIPLLVNHYYISSGLCRLDDETQVKSQCKEAYVVAAKLTGVSQLVALFFAPVFGFFSDKVRSYHLPLLIAAVSGLLGYGAIAFFIKTPDPSRPGGSYWIYPVVSLLGVGQIGSIVCSLELLSSTITASMSPDAENPALENRDIAPDEQAVSDERDDGNGEAQSLLRKKHFDNYNLSHLQGSIAGTYSLAGGAGILLL
ncbi:hypothetical protein MMC10_010725 [Thelotrema lepadinum]|nr:hypothetical protein [Thelotrema lepadinum]